MTIFFWGSPESWTRLHGFADHVLYRLVSRSGTWFNRRIASGFSNRRTTTTYTKVPFCRILCRKLRHNYRHGPRESNTQITVLETAYHANGGPRFFAERIEHDSKSVSRSNSLVNCACTPAGLLSISGSRWSRTTRVFKQRIYSPSRYYLRYILPTRRG